MNKEKISDWIDSIIQDLTDPNKTLEDCLRKTLVLSYNLKNDKLKTWVENELNSYQTVESVPEYRRVGYEIWGELAQSTFGGLIRRKNILYIDDNDPMAKELENGWALRSNVASLESIVILKTGDASLTFSLHPRVIGKINVNYPDWTIEKAWIQISEFTITATLSKIKTNLLQFLLTLNEELGDANDYSIMQNSQKVDHMLEHTIGHIHAENVTFGTNYQTKGNRNNVIQGNNGTQNVTDPDTIIAEVKELTTQIVKLLKETTDLKSDIKEDIEHELQAVSIQISREKPNFGIVNKSLQIVEDLLLNVTATVYTPVVLELLTHITTRLSGF